MFQKVLAGTLALITFGCLLSAQDAPPKQDDQPPRYYRLDFSVKDIQEGKVLDVRTYFVYLSDRKGSRPCSVRADSKVTMPAGKSGDYREFSLGTGIDCGYESETRDTLGLNVQVNVNTLVPYEDKSEPNPVPIVRSNRWNSDVLVTLRKPTTIFSSDDIASKRKVQVELTATPLNP